MGESHRSFLASLAALVACSAPVPLLEGQRSYVSYDAGTTWAEAPDVYGHLRGVWVATQAGVGEVLRMDGFTVRGLV